MKTIVFPENFLLENEYISEAIETLSMMISHNKDCYELDFSKVKNLRRGDLMVLVAQIEKSVKRGNQLKRVGNFQDGLKIKLMMTHLFNVKHDKTIHWQINDVNEFQRAENLIPEVIAKIVKDLWKIGIREYFYPFNTFLTELIGNAVEHGIKDKEINWWLDREVNRTDKTIKFTFVDMGKGIVESHKKAGLPLQYIFSSDSKVVLDSFSGQLRSSTKLPNRGRGLPQLMEMIEKGWVSDLVIITNSVSLQYKNDNFAVTDIPNFRGTYYSWNINSNNFQRWKSLK